MGVSDTRQYLLERIDDAAVIQIYADGFTTLPLRDKILVWHLYLAALAGRDIFYDQRHALNVEIRDVLEHDIGDRLREARLLAPHHLDRKVAGKCQRRRIGNHGHQRNTYAETRSRRPARITCCLKS